MLANTKPDTRSALLQAAEQILVTRGVHALTVRKVGAVSGLNGTLITYHFGGIGSLLQELAMLNMQPMVAAWNAISSGNNPHQILQSWLSPLLNPAAFHPEARALVVLDEIASHGDSCQARPVMDEMVKAGQKVEEALLPLLPHLDRQELHLRLRFIAGGTLGPPPRTPLIDKAAEFEIWPDEISLTRFASCALSLPTQSQ
ncbi:MAG: TetR/AcrR family transcriptional regulator [Sphingomonadaceae bacterium]